MNSPERVKRLLVWTILSSRQSQPASATLRNIFEKDLSRSQEIEFFSRSGINFLPDLGYFSFCNRTDVGSFRDILPYQLVAVFYGSFLPCAIGIGKIHGHVELLGYPFMLGELTAVVRGDGLQGLSLVWQQPTRFLPQASLSSRA